MDPLLLYLCSGLFSTWALFVFAAVQLFVLQYSFASIKHLKSGIFLRTSFGKLSGYSIFWIPPALGNAMKKI
jgi:hypothetical protein